MSYVSSLIEGTGLTFAAAGAVAAPPPPPDEAAPEAETLLQASTSEPAPREVNPLRDTEAVSTGRPLPAAEAAAAAAAAETPPAGAQPASFPPVPDAFAAPALTSTAEREALAMQAGEEPGRQPLASLGDTGVAVPSQLSQPPASSVPVDDTVGAAPAAATSETPLASSPAATPRREPPLPAGDPRPVFETLAVVRAWVAVTPAPDEAPLDAGETIVLPERAPEPQARPSAAAPRLASPSRFEAPPDAAEARNVTLSIGAIELTVEEPPPASAVAPPPAPSPVESEGAAVRLRRHYYNGWGGL